MSDDEDRVVVVIDNGSGNCKAGFAGEDVPSVQIPTVVGHSKYEGFCSGIDASDSYVGSEAQEKRSVLSLHYPVERGTVTNWDDMEEIWRHLYSKELRQDPKDFSVLLSEALFTPRAQREKMCEIFFETFEVPSLYVESDPVLAFYARGGPSGVSVVSGEGLTQILPIYESHGLFEGAVRLDLAGSDVTEHLAKLLKKRGYSLDFNPERETLRLMKEKHCYVAENLIQEAEKAQTYLSLNEVDSVLKEDSERSESKTNNAMHSSQTASTSSSSKESSSSSLFGDRVCSLSSYQEVTIREERYQCVEALFDPTLIDNYDAPGLHKAVFQSIMNVPIDTRADLFAYIVVSGGNTLFPGFRQRLEDGIRNMAPEAKRRIRVCAPREENVYFVWIGGSILGSLSSFNDMLVARDVYDEKGPSIVHSGPYGEAMPDHACNYDVLGS